MIVDEFPVSRPVSEPRNGIECEIRYYGLFTSARDNLATRDTAITGVHGFLELRGTRLKIPTDEP